MTAPLPPLNEHNSDTDRSDAQQTRPNPSSQATPSQPIARVPANQRPMTPHGHVQAPVPQRGAPSQPARRVPVRRRGQAAFYLPWWSVLAMLIVVLVVAFGIVGVVLTLGSRPPVVQVTPIIRIITAQPTANTGAGLALPSLAPVIVVGSPAPPPQLALEGPTLPPVVFTPTPVPIVVGSTVAVSGVEREQLNVRDRAGVQGTTVLFRATEGTVFSIIGGPTQADGFTWWQIQNPAAPDQAGWAVANYLRVIVEGQ
jgi:hypothetical protein